MEPQNITTQSSQTASKEFKKPKIILVLAYINVIVPILMKVFSVFTTEHLSFIGGTSILAFVSGLCVIFTKKESIYKVFKVVLIIYSIIYLLMNIILFYMFVIVGNS
jgi:hypothetical protein